MSDEGTPDGRGRDTPPGDPIGGFRFGSKPEDRGVRADGGNRSGDRPGTPGGRARVKTDGPGDEETNTGRSASDLPVLVLSVVPTGVARLRAAVFYWLPGRSVDRDVAEEDPFEPSEGGFAMDDWMVSSDGGRTEPPSEAKTVTGSADDIEHRESLFVTVVAGSVDALPGGGYRRAESVERKSESGGSTSSSSATPFNTGLLATLPCVGGAARDRSSVEWESEAGGFDFDGWLGIEDAPAASTEAAEATATEAAATGAVVDDTPTPDPSGGTGTGIGFPGAGAGGSTFRLAALALFAASAVAVALTIASTAGTVAPVQAINQASIATDSPTPTPTATPTPEPDDGVLGPILGGSSSDDDGGIVDGL